MGKGEQEHKGEASYGRWLFGMSLWRATPQRSHTHHFKISSYECKSALMTLGTELYKNRMLVTIIVLKGTICKFLIRDNLSQGDNDAARMTVSY